MILEKDLLGRFLIDDALKFFFIDGALQHEIPSKYDFVYIPMQASELKGMNLF